MNRILYLGLTIPKRLALQSVIHCPLIRIVPRPKDDPHIQIAFQNFQNYTHLLFTSKSAVSIFLEYASYYNIELSQIQSKQLVAVGTQTAACLMEYTKLEAIIAKNESAEGVIDCLSTMNLKESSLFWPHSALSRDVLEKWMKEKRLNYYSPIFYDTYPLKPETIPSSDSYDEIIFTSSSVVKAFIEFFGPLPRDKIITSIGSMTQKTLDDL